MSGFSTEQLSLEFAKQLLDLRFDPGEAGERFELGEERVEGFLAGIIRPLLGESLAVLKIRRSLPVYLLPILEEVAGNEAFIEMRFSAE